MKEQLFFFFLHAFAVFYDLVSIRNLFQSCSLSLTFPSPPASLSGLYNLS